MKKIIVVILAVIAIGSVLAGCANSKAEITATGNQEQFLKDMAKGIEDRLSKSDTDTSAMTQEELMEHYKELVSFELDRVKKYEGQTFADENFDMLAHLYISACTMQYEATQNYKNDSLYSALWNGGRTVRSGIIITMYEKYDLPISAEQAEGYRTTTTTTTEISISGDTELSRLFDSGDPDIVLSVGDLLITDAEVTFKKDGYDSKYDQYEYSFTVQNNSEYSLESISLELAITDLDGNILGSETQWVSHTVDAGKSAVMKGSIYTSTYSTPFCIVPDEYLYDGNGDSNVYGIDADPTNAAQYTLKVVASSEQVEHICEECSKAGTHTYNSFTGQTEYYCAEHYLELLEMLESLGVD